MRLRRLFWIVLIVVLAAAGISAIILRNSSITFALPWTLGVPAKPTLSSNKTLAQPQEGSSAAANAASIELLPSDVTQVRVADLRQVLPLSGALQATRQAPVKTRVAGEIRQVLVREGESVQAGQVLATMDTTEYLARAAQAKGAVVAAGGQLAIAGKARDTNQALLTKGFISQNAFDTASSQYQIAKANLDSANAGLAITQKALADTTIRAPLSGLVSNRTVQPGERVAVDFHLLDIVDLRRMEMEAAVPTSEILQVALGQKVHLTIAGVAIPISGKVVRINPATQAGSRSIIVYVEVANPGGQLRAGMFAEAQLILAQHQAVLTIPSAAVREFNGKPVVYAIEHSILRQVPVTLGMTGEDGQGPAVEVISGLAEGVQIVRGNLGNLMPDMQVTFAKSPVISGTAKSLPGAE